MRIAKAGTACDTTIFVERITADNLHKNAAATASTGWPGKVSQRRMTAHIGWTIGGVNNRRPGSVQDRPWFLVGGVYPGEDFPTHAGIRY
ncbi:hypothetical protein [Methylogaea oryzae]|uniref:hypothetical protein n=1 Tax=Methylogaea oryzae TaxID=1295382 RepID=UPI0012E29027|nr:hypothetical protein [Methylogaea oryzae]